MSKIKVLVSGCNGHMGQIICRLISESDDMEVVAGFDTAMHEFSEFSVFESISDLKDWLTEDENICPDIIIDFSSPDCTMKILDLAVEYSIDMVIGTTGLSDDQLAKIKDASLEISILRSANMSYEVNLVSKILKEISPKLADSSDIEIVEAHHNRKIDAPSGTAKMLAETINSSLGNTKEILFNRSGKREDNEIGIISLRGGDIVGTHSIYYFGKYEILEITHKALSRDLFADGALKAARFIYEASKTLSNGLYSMEDLM